MDYSQTAFTSFIDNVRGLATKNRFELIATIPGAITEEVADAPNKLNMLCESGMLPSKRILTMDGIGYKSSYKYPYSYSQGDLSFTFLLDGNYTAKVIFERWLRLIVDHDSKEIAYHDDITANSWTFYQLRGHQQSDRIYGMRLFEVFPVDVSEITFSNAESNTIQQVNVTVAYSRSENV